MNRSKIKTKPPKPLEEHATETHVEWKSSQLHSTRDEKLWLSPHLITSQWIHIENLILNRPSFPSRLRRNNRVQLFKQRKEIVLGGVIERVGTSFRCFPHGRQGIHLCIFVARNRFQRINSLSWELLQSTKHLKKFASWGSNATTAYPAFNTIHFYYLNYDNLFFFFFFGGGGGKRGCCGVKYLNKTEFFHWQF